MHLPTPDPAFSDPLDERRLVSFFERFCAEKGSLGYGLGHLAMAAHAALPAALTPDLAYQIWLNFRNARPDRPWAPEAVSDLLLSGLVEPSGPKVFEMRPEIRLFLLDLLKNTVFWRSNGWPAFGAERLDELADFLKKYAAARLNGHDAATTALREAQIWAAESWSEPSAAVEKIQKALSQAVSKGQKQEQARLGLVLERLEKQADRSLLSPSSAGRPIALSDLATYGRGLRSHLFGEPPERTMAHFEQIGHRFETPQTAALPDGQRRLRLPLPRSVLSKMPIERAEAVEKGRNRRVFALCIGIDTYLASGFSPLSGCARDAEAFAKALIEKTSGARIALLKNEAATDEAIANALSGMAMSAGATDLVVVYRAGHVQQSGSDFFWINHDTPRADHFSQSALWRALVEQRSELPNFLFLDCASDSIAAPKKVVLKAGRNPGLSMERVFEGETRGVFGFHFVKTWLAEPDLPLFKLAARLRARMADHLLETEKLAVLQAPSALFWRPLLKPQPSRAFLWQERLASIDRWAEPINGIWSPALDRALGIGPSRSEADEAEFLSEKERFLTEAAQRPALVFVFSDLGDHRLPGASEELSFIRKLAAEQADRAEFRIFENPTPEAVEAVFIEPGLRQRIALFHYSGPETFVSAPPEIEYESERESFSKSRPIKKTARPTRGAAFDERRPVLPGMVLSDGQGGRQLFQWLEWCGWLRFQENLKLVFVNSCFGTLDFEHFKTVGARAAIACEGSLSDSYATLFSRVFYEELLGKGASLREAFERAKAGSSVMEPGSAPLELTSFSEKSVLDQRFFADEPAGERAAEGLSFEARFVGARPFSEKERHLFFGREREAEALFKAVQSAQLVVLTGETGCGKTSLAAAGLSPRLKKAGFRPVWARFSAPYEKGSFSEWPTEGWAEASGLVPVFVFDQFEEVWLSQSDKSRAALFEDLREAIFAKSKAPRRAIFIVRSEQLERLGEASRAFPSIFENIVRLEPLTLTAARKAIVLPAGLYGPYPGAPFELSGEALEELLGELSANGEKAVDLAQLQAICQKIEALALEKRLRRIESSDLDPHFFLENSTERESANQNFAEPASKRADRKRNDLKRKK